MALRVAMKRNTQTPSFALVQTQHRCLSCRLQQLEARRRHPTRHNIMQRHIIASAVPVPASSGSEKGIPAPIEGTVVLQRIQQQFDNRAAAYDQDNTYHPPLAQRLLSLCELRPGQRLLDLATGTGLVALPAAAAVGTIGFVAAVDISQAMLDQAQSKYTASRQLQDHPQQQQGLAPVQFIHGNIEQLDSCLPDDWQGSFDAITCSAAVPFLQDPAAAFQQWRYWLKPHSGRLVFNAFVAPAVEDFGTFVKLARQYGLPHETDPCENLGSVELVSAVLQNAGYLNVEVMPEPKQRWYAAPTLETYAEKMYQMAVSSNPFSDPERMQQLGGNQHMLHDAFVAAVVEDIKSSGRHDAAADRVLSKYTVLHVRARVA